MVTYMIMALAVALLAGLTGAMPIPVVRIPRSEADADTTADEPLQHHCAHRELPSEILNALVEAQRVSSQRLGRVVSCTDDCVPTGFDGTNESVRVSRWSEGRAANLK